jgi:hypothetical protein
VLPLTRHSGPTGAEKILCPFRLPDGRLIPFVAYKLFYRGERMATTARIRTEIREAVERCR